MLYKVLIVEDEIVTREGIRDNVDWQGRGFNFCGEASDGEIALQLLQSTQPDLMITDIKMPFMDGLQLCRIVRDRMPWIEIVILSGHDEFEYAQQAIKLGVNDYLLKPITVQDLHNVLNKLYQRLEQKRKERENLHQLQQQVQESCELLKENFLHKLVIGAVSYNEAIQKSDSLSMNLIAKHYLVVIIKTALTDRTELFDYDEYLSLQSNISNMFVNNPDILLLKKDWEDYVIILKGEHPELLINKRDALLQLIIQDVKKTRYQVTIGLGGIKNRLSDLYQSFTEALININNVSYHLEEESFLTTNKSELLKLNPSAIENFLSSAAKDDYEIFFNTNIKPLGEAALNSPLIKNYLFIDFALNTAKFINTLGGDVEDACSAFYIIDSILANTSNLEQLKNQLYIILMKGIAFRDNHINKHNKQLLYQAKKYMDEHYHDSNLSLQETASNVNLSPSHFSMVFSQEYSQTFKDYLIEIRIKKAKELLRMTNLKSIEIAEQVGYSDPHYFSYVFKKHIRLTPTEFRNQVKNKEVQD